jgi:mRNA interferase MazF
LTPANARRGEVWLVDFSEPVGHEQGWKRPAVVMSSDHLNDSAACLVIVVPVTSTRWGLPSHVEIETGRSGLADTSYAKGEDIKSVSQGRLVTRYGLADEQVVRRLQVVLRTLLEL